MDRLKIRLKVFRSLCWHNCDFMCAWIPLPTTVIAQILKISLYQCRKQMKLLVQDGLAESCACILDKEESLLPYRGYRITDKGRKTDIYKYCQLQQARICAKCFDTTVKSWLPSDFDKRWLGKEA